MSRPPYFLPGILSTRPFIGSFEWKSREKGIDDDTVSGTTSWTGYVSGGISRAIAERRMIDALQAGIGRDQPAGTSIDHRLLTLFFALGRLEASYPRRGPRPFIEFDQTSGDALELPAVSIQELRSAVNLLQDQQAGVMTIKNGVTTKHDETDAVSQAPYGPRILEEVRSLAASIETLRAEMHATSTRETASWSQPTVEDAPSQHASVSRSRPAAEDSAAAVGGILFIGVVLGIVVFLCYHRSAMAVIQVLVVLVLLFIAIVSVKA